MWTWSVTINTPPKFDKFHMTSFNDYILQVSPTQQEVSPFHILTWKRRGVSHLFLPLRLHRLWAKDISLQHHTPALLLQEDLPDDRNGDCSLLPLVSWYFLRLTELQGDWDKPHQIHISHHPTLGCQGGSDTEEERRDSSGTITRTVSLVGVFLCRIHVQQNACAFNTMPPPGTADSWSELIS